MSTLGDYEQPWLVAHERYGQVCNSENGENEQYFLLFCPVFTAESKKYCGFFAVYGSGFNVYPMPRKNWSHNMELAYLDANQWMFLVPIK